MILTSVTLVRLDTLLEFVNSLSDGYIFMFKFIPHINEVITLT